MAGLFAALTEEECVYMMLMSKNKIERLRVLDKLIRRKDSKKAQPTSLTGEASTDPIPSPINLISSDHPTGPLLQTQITRRSASNAQVIVRPSTAHSALPSPLRAYQVD